MADLTPTEELALEVLIARARLGEHLWTFHSSASKALRSLEAKGLVHVMSGVTENTVRAYFTDEGAVQCLRHPYHAPILKDYAETIAKYLNQIGYDDNAASIIRKKFGSKS